MSERDELADDFARDIWWSGAISNYTANRISQGLRERGYRKLRAVTTAAELDALPVGSVVLDNEGDAWQHRGYAAYQWCNTTGGRNHGLDTSEFAAEYLPATVLHEANQ